MSASDELQAATFNALGGYYRVAIDCLRPALESLTITSYCQARAARKQFEEWQRGERDIAFGEVCDNLMAVPCVQQLSTVVLTKCGVDLFSQQQGKRQRGWVRTLYSGLSEYSHSRPGFEAAHMWGGSNGPIYEKGAFKWTHRFWLQTLAILAARRPAKVMSFYVFPGPGKTS